MDEVNFQYPHNADPEGVRLLLSKTGSSESESVLVGDSLIDAEAARRSELPFIAILTGQTDRIAFEPFNPVAILKSVIELTDVPEFSTNLGSP